MSKPIISIDKSIVFSISFSKKTIVAIELFLAILKIILRIFNSKGEKNLKKLHDYL